jgi:hypothetical protein
MRVPLALIVSALLCAASGEISLPAPTGSFPVGRQMLLWSDTARPEDVEKHVGKTRQPELVEKHVSLNWWKNTSEKHVGKTRQPELSDLFGEKHVSLGKTRQPELGKTRQPELSDLFGEKHVSLGKTRQPELGKTRQPELSDLFEAYSQSRPSGSLLRNDVALNHGLV